MSRPIKSLEGFIRKVSKLTRRAGHTNFFRGHADENYRLLPSIFRDEKHLRNEDIMFNELVASNPTDFSEDRSTLEKLARMQHHSLPTRLLDITSNPLMGLYFTCCDGTRKTGEVIVLSVPRSEIRFFDSDTASVIANLARMDFKSKAEVGQLAMGPPRPSVDEFNAEKQVQVRRLLHFIGEEKPYFAPKIRPEDVARVICVRSKMSNSRIISQAGAFLLFGQDGEIESKGTSPILMERIAVDGSKKKQILKELDTLKINASTVFPYIENSAKYISARYKTKRRTKK